MFKKKIWIPLLALGAVLVTVAWASFGGDGSPGELIEDESAPIEKRLNAIGQLGGQQHEQNKQQLIRLAGHDHPRLATAAMRSLSHYENVRPEIYLNRLGAQDVSLREAAAIGLGSTRDTTQHIHLIKMLQNDPEPTVRAAAAAGLAKKTNWDAVPAIVSGLRDPDLMVRRRAHMAMRAYVKMSFRYKPNAPKAQREKAIKLMVEFMKTNGVKTH